MNTVERHQKIIHKINHKGQVKSQMLCEELDVSSVTIRKDLKFLEEKGMLYRMHGGATLSNPYAIDRHLNEKEKLYLDEKMRIGIAASKLITVHDSVLMASGTTVLALAKNISPLENLTVITSALNVAIELNQHREIEVIQLAGILRKRSSSVTGMFAEENLKDFSCTKLFMGVDGIDLEFGLTTANVAEARLNREMIKVSQKTIVLVDSSKFGKRGFGRICGFDNIDEIITDNQISNFSKSELENFGIKITIV
ncbi:DeoR/GlpR family DNA-binding transcription regulator [Gramella sp. AN32]|uniref:DeoR/GlpR family DNA-binding transcription regulator n=1 Tax=Christiangramia antarctica TaxID=2058158 RepID=A0ABW5X1Y7_9FLAO|nr:DeoR/GlpR family DNA-binding transcription regulator [Gramella sp. AN32]MCM4155766.1 transcriptional regulator [Gramella sp. AN32]